MSGIKMSDCKFYIDEDTRTVVCVIADTEDLSIRDSLNEFISENFRYNDINIEWAIAPKLYDELQMPKSFMGKAVCAEEDEWDEEAGMLLAFKRAKTKFYNSFFKRANYLMKRLDTRLDDMVQAFSEFGIKIEDNMNAIDKKINDKLPEEKE